MDIHRCRFVPFPPSTINALAFSHSSLSRKQKQKAAPPRLAVGRANGDIEIWNPQKGSWLQETIIRGGKDRSIDGLVWTQDPSEEVNGRLIIGKSRLFSIGYTTTVTEWDLSTGRPLRQVSGNHGEIWCIAAQPSLVLSEKGANSAEWPGQNLVAGCTDGAIVLYSTKDEDLQLQRLMVRPSSKSAKIISVIFQTRNVVVAGCTDSKIRIYDIRNGALIRAMSLGSGPKGGPKEIIVWSVKVLKDGTIVSGDSTGEVRIWDGKTYTLKQRIQSHKQDVLSLATNNDGTAIFSGGMDRRTVVYKPVGKWKRWAEVAHRRFHSHDVKTMASFESGGISVIVSGGPDASPTVIPLDQFGFEAHRTLPFLPQDSSIGSSPQKRLMMGWWDREVHIWRLGKASQPDPENIENEDEPSMRNRKLVAKILIKGEANITSAALSQDGNLLAVSTISEIKVFYLQSRKPTEGEGLKITKITVPSSTPFGARLVQFSPDGKWLTIIQADSRITLLRIAPSSTSSSITIIPQQAKLTRINRKVEKLILLGGVGSYDRTITQIAFSADSTILAVSDLAGYVDTFVLSGDEDSTQPTSTPDEDAASASDSDEESDSEDEEKLKPRLIFGQCWTRNPSASLLPKLPSAPTVLSFRPASPKALDNGIVSTQTNSISKNLPPREDRLVVITATSDVFEFEVLKGGLSSWSRRNPTSCFPEEWMKAQERVKGVVWDLSVGRERMWLYSVNRLFMFDFRTDFKGPDSSTGDSKKRKRNVGSGAGGAISDEKSGMGISRKVQSIVDEDFVEENLLGGGEDAMDIDEESDEEGNLEIERLKREDDEVEREKENAGEQKPRQESDFYTTLKYRPIMGVVVVGAGESEFGPEVALVERPSWDLELAPRYYGNQEWKEKDNAEQL